MTWTGFIEHFARHDPEGFLLTVLVLTTLGLYGLAGVAFDQKDESTVITGSCDPETYRSMYRDAVEGNARFMIFYDRDRGIRREGKFIITEIEGLGKGFYNQSLERYTIHIEPWKPTCTIDALEQFRRAWRRFTRRFGWELYKRWRIWRYES